MSGVSDSDYIYLNAKIYNSGTTDIKATYRNVLNDALIDKPDDYIMSIIRFQISGQSIPIFHFSENTYKVCLTYSGTDFPVTLTYVSVETPNNNEVYYFQQFLDSINDAFVSAVTALNVAYPATLNPTTETPFMIFNKAQESFSLIVPKRFNTISVDVFMNKPLYEFFESIYAIFLGYNQANGKDFQIVIEDTQNNTWSLDATKYNLEQEVPNVGLWFSIDRIIVLTGSIPVAGEYISTTQTLGGLSPSEKIITDFVVQISKLSDYLSSLNYLPTAEYRRASLVSDRPMRQIDYTVKYITQDGTVYPLILRPGMSVNMKFMFERKTALRKNV